jgi:hypothetical protein
MAAATDTRLLHQLELIPTILQNKCNNKRRELSTSRKDEGQDALPGAILVAKCVVDSSPGMVGDFAGVV